MSDSSEAFQLLLEDGAKQAVSTIASLLGDKQPEEAVERALGTELYLLQKVRMEKAKIFVEYTDGTRAEVYLLS